MINNFMLIAEHAEAIGAEKAFTYVTVLGKIEATCRKFSFKQLNETSMNYRNIMFQNLFKIYGRLRMNPGFKDCKCSVIEFYNEELADQVNAEKYSFEKTLNLKSLLNVGVCLNGGLSRVHEQGRLGHRDRLLHGLLHLR